MPYHPALTSSRSQCVVRSYLCLDISDRLQHSRGFFFFYTSSLLLQPFLQPRVIVCVICGGLGGFVESPGISLSFYTTRPQSSGLQVSWRCKLTCQVLSPMLFALDDVLKQEGGSNFSSDLLYET